MRMTFIATVLRPLGGWGVERWETTAWTRGPVGYREVTSSTAALPPCADGIRRRESHDPELTDRAAGGI